MYGPHLMQHAQMVDCVKRPKYTCSASHTVGGSRRMRGRLGMATPPMAVFVLVLP